MQLGLYFDQTRCLGCYTCVAACRSSHYLEPEQPDIITITSHEKGEFPRVELFPIFLTCFHCEAPPCVDACPYKLFVKRKEDGVVIIENPEGCTRCNLCMEACPYGAPRILMNGTAIHGIMIYKCDLCPELRERGLSPACVVACPVEAIEIKPLEDLVRQYGDCRQGEGYPDGQKTKPSVIFRRSERKFP